MSVLRDADDATAVVVCNTCRFSAEERETSDGVRGGALLAAVRVLRDDRRGHTERDGDADDATAVVVCNTCRFSAEERETSDGVRGGALLAAALRAAAAGTDVAIQEMACLFNCTQHCSIHLRAPGKIGYVLGRFEPTAEAAEAIIAYAQAYAASEEGVVPYRQWPDGVKGHFIVRVPPAGKLVGD